MAPSSLLSRVPALRVLLPFMLGIGLHRLWHCWWMPVALAAIAACALAMMSVVRSPGTRYRLRPYYIVPLALIALSLGWIAAIIHCPPHINQATLDGTSVAGRVERVDFTDFSMRLTVKVLDKNLPPCRVLLSTRGCNYTMRAGDIIAWPCAVVEVANMGNPDEMDYAQYLLDSQGIRYEQHLPVGQVIKFDHSPTLTNRLTNLRTDIARMVLNTSLSPASQHFVVALLLGDSSMIDKATRQEFSTAGIAHVLALSGLHVGLIALILWWLLFPLDYVRLKKLRLVVTLAAMALFAVFTGLSPSVVRATVMMAFVFASVVFYRRHAPLNALVMAAFLILVFAPSALFTVGFQLSFITVGALLMSAHLPLRVDSRYKVVKYLASLVVSSLVTMLATVALSAHYFHTVSFMSVITNLLILPVLPVFMIIGALFLLVTAAGMQWTWLDRATDAFYQYISGVARIVNALPGSHWGGAYVSWAGVVGYFVVLTLVVLYVYRRNIRLLLWAGMALALLLCHSVWVESNTSRSGIVVFNDFAATPVVCHDHGTAWVWMPDQEQPDSAAFARRYIGFLSRHGIDRLVFLTAQASPHARMTLMGKQFVAVGPGKWKHLEASSPVVADGLIVTKRFNGSAAKLKELFTCDRLIISGAMHRTQLDPLLHDCDSLDIHVHNLSTQGALITETRR